MANNGHDSNKWNCSFLTKLIEHHLEKITPVKYHLNLITLQLCIERNNLGIPKELWNIICKYIKYDIKHFKSNKWYEIYCPRENIYKNIYAIERAEYCPDDGAKLNLWLTRFSQLNDFENFYQNFEIR